MKYPKYLLTALLIGPAFALAHGEDKPGPHGGNVEMPGAFHTELVLDKDQSAHIYLIDINFQNPTTKDSSVKVFARNNKTEVPFSCSIMHNHFHCIPSKKYKLTGELVVEAVREKAAGNQAVYKLPLKFGKADDKKESTSEHSHH